MATTTFTLFSGSLSAGTHTTATATVPSGVTKLELDLQLTQAEADDLNTSITYTLQRQDADLAWRNEVSFTFTGGPNQGDLGAVTPNLIVCTTDIGRLVGKSIRGVFINPNALSSVTATVKVS